MNILSAIYAGQNGIWRSIRSFEKAAETVAIIDTLENPPLAESFATFAIEAAALDANTRVIEVADTLMNDWVNGVCKK